MTDYQTFLLKLNNNLNILQEREAKHGAGNAPLELINQIDDHQEAIELTEQAIEWKQTGGLYNSLRGPYSSIRGQNAVGTGGVVSEGTGGQDTGPERGVLPSRLLNLILGSDKIEGQHKDEEIKVVSVEEIYFKDKKEVDAHQ